MLGAEHLFDALIILENGFSDIFNHIDRQGGDC